MRRPLRILAPCIATLISACGGGSGPDSEPAAADLAAGGRACTLAAAAPATSGQALTVRARGSILQGIGPVMEVRVGGTVIGSAEVRNGSAQDYSFAVAALPVGTRIDVVFTNHALIGGVHRGLHVESVQAGGSTLASTAAGVTFDRGAGAAAFDGIDVLAGRVSLWAPGALRFTATAAMASRPAATALTAADAVRLAHQASFGPSETLVAQMQAQGAAAWVSAQMALNTSRYTLGQGDAIHKHTSNTSFCSLPAQLGTPCWRDWYSATPLVWDFYRNALNQPDQLRQRVAWALQQIVVVSELEVSGTYGLRGYHNMLLDNAFANYRDVLKRVVLSPVMGDYLNNVNNDAAAPNENFGRELLQLFSLGTCLLNADGSPKGGTCTPTYDNDTVRNYAYALTGWTYPAGGATPWGCWPTGANCPYYGGDMLPVARYHDTGERRLLSGITVAAGSSAPQALEAVLDSLVAHPNMAPFIGRQLIQHLVTSNPSGAYVQRVAAAFTAGRFTSGGFVFGQGKKGDLAATVAAVLFDAEARTAVPAASAGRLREPALMMAGVLRALGGRTDGEALGWQWGEALGQHLFRPPSVFNWYSPDTPVAGTSLVGPAFGIHTPASALARLNYLTYLLFWDGSKPVAGVPGAVGTQVDLNAFTNDAGDAAKLVDRLSLLATGGPLPPALREQIVAATLTVTPQNSSSWQLGRVRQAAMLVFASPDYQVTR